MSIIPLLESAPIAMTVVSQTGAILFVNGKLEDLFGYDRGELLGQPVEVLMPERFHKIHRQHRADYMGAPHMRSMGSAMDLAARRKDGSEFPIEAGLSYLQFGDQMVIMTTITDVSRRKQTELVLEQRVEERTHELERRQRVSDGLGHIVGMLNSNQPLEAVLDHIVTKATHLLDAAACAIFRYQERSHDLVLQVSHGFTGLALN
ncbi:MAG: PAS domain S-box protein, partial [Caldilineaceae bacterium]|nr:PAS domain S-box protein [Caldilineaceae bacterium]